MANVSDFLALLAKHNVPNDVFASVDEKKFYGGLNMKGTVRISLPLTIAVSEELVSERDGDIEEFEGAHILIAQRYVDCDSMFVPYHYPYPMTDCEIVGRNFDDFTVLDRLLSGETVRFYESAHRGTPEADTSTRWVDVTLNRVM